VNSGPLPSPASLVVTLEPLLFGIQIGVDSSQEFRAELS